MPANPFHSIDLGNGITISGSVLLLALGGIAIATGVFTYSKGVMMTIGGNLGRLTPTSALVVVTAQSIVLLMFASRGLEAWLTGHGLPALPLVPVSSSQAVVGAVFGIAILQGTSGVRWQVLGRIVAGWAVTPVTAGLICFIGLFFLQNVFGLTVK